MVLFEPKPDCNYLAPIDLAPNELQFGAKSIGKGYLQSCYGLNQTDSGLISLYAVRLFSPIIQRPLPSVAFKGQSFKVAHERVAQ